MKCASVRREISNYLDRDLDAALRQQMDRHLKSCPHCRSALDGARNLVRLAGDARAFRLPSGFSDRLKARLEEHLEPRQHARPQVAPDIPVGITDDRVALGSHLLYFFESDQDFERGVRFFYPGLGKGEHCIAFGHQEALERVQQVLRSNGFDPDRLIQKRQLTLLRRQAAAPVTLSDIEDLLEAAVRAGASPVRFLGNLGVERDPLPAGEDDVTNLENQVTGLISRFPCVVVCMYDVRTLPGRMILKGGLEQHRLAVCSAGVRENPYYVPEQGSARPCHVH
ncbi:MAG: MEDS domain-containing protein [Terriglobales bacterium]